MGFMILSVKSSYLKEWLFRNDDYVFKTTDDGQAQKLVEYYIKINRSI